VEGYHGRSIGTVSRAPRWDILSIYQSKHAVSSFPTSKAEEQMIKEKQIQQCFVKVLEKLGVLVCYYPHMLSLRVERSTCLLLTL
jgi:hypothetical protein